MYTGHFDPIQKFKSVFNYCINISQTYKHVQFAVTSVISPDHSHGNGCLYVVPIPNVVWTLDRNCSFLATNWLKPLKLPLKCYFSGFDCLKILQSCLTSLVYVFSGFECCNKLAMNWNLHAVNSLIFHLFI